MNRSLLAIIVIIVVALLAIGGYVAFKPKPSATPLTNNSAASSSNQTQSTPPPNSTSTVPAAATITFSDSGFSPASVTIKAGERVKVVNNSGQPLQFESNPHPTHTDNTELNVGEVDPGSSATFVVSRTGTWGYHDHLNPSLTGSIHVE